MTHKTHKDKSFVTNKESTVCIYYQKTAIFVPICTYLYSKKHYLKPPKSTAVPLQLYHSPGEKILAFMNICY